MSQCADVQDFVGEVNRITAIDQLQSLLSSAMRMLGFDYYGLAHHVSRLVAGPGTIRISDYPQSWAEMVLANGYWTEDPVFAASEKSIAPFEWSDLPDIIELSPRQLAMIEDARDTGVGDGFVVPVHMPGEYSGSCCFSMRPGRELPVRSFPAAQYVGCFAFEAARRLLRASSRSWTLEEQQDQPLTQRQLDCLVLAAQGKSDWDIGRLLGISNQTVHKHIEESKRRYGVPTRMQLVVRALFDGHLTFADVLN